MNELMNETMENSMMNETMNGNKENSMMNETMNGKRYDEEMFDLTNVMPHCPVMLVLDTSHSMWGRGMQDLARAVGDFFRTIESAELPDSMIDIAGVSMGDNLCMLDEFRPLRESGLRNLSIRPKGHTPIGGALELALRKLDEKTVDYSRNGISVLTPHLVLLSDGISSDDFDGVAEEIRSRVGRGALVCRAVALGGHPDLDSLQRIAGGDVLIPRQDDLRQAFTEVGRQVSQRCEAAADEVMGETVTAEVEPEEQPGEQATGGTLYLLDGSNILHWGKAGRGVSLRPVLAIAEELKRRGESYQVYFDASARHLLKSAAGELEQYEKLLADDPDHFQQVPAGTRADDFLLLIASQDSSARIMTQDRFKDYADRYPQVVRADRLLPGMVVRDQIYFPGIDLKIPFSAAENC